jgi:hypothetical protein
MDTEFTFLHWPPSLKAQIDSNAGTIAAVKEFIKQSADYTYKTKEHFNIDKDGWGLVTFQEFDKDSTVHNTEVWKRLLDWALSTGADFGIGKLQEILEFECKTGKEGIAKNAVEYICSYQLDFQFELLKAYSLVQFENFLTSEKK